MKKNIDFDEIGKRVPYQIPADFFGVITNRTLELARARKKKVIKMRYSIAAASVILILTFGIILNRTNTEEKSAFQRVNRPLDTTVPEPVRLISAPLDCSKISNPVNHPAKIPEEDGSSESLENILLAMNREELSFFIQQLSTEIFIDEIHNN